MIKDTITQRIAEALKSRDEIRLSTLRLLLSALNYARIDKRSDLTEEEELDIVRKEAKKRKDAIEAYEKAGAKDRAEKEGKELEILKEYLPEDMSDEEIEKLIIEGIKNTGAVQIKDMGKVIGFVMQAAKGQADGKKVTELVKNKLTSQT